MGGISLPREPILDSVIVWACSACSACGAFGGLFFIIFSSAPAAGSLYIRRLRRALFQFFLFGACGRLFFQTSFGACGGLFFKFFSSAPAAGSFSNVPLRRQRRALFQRFLFGACGGLFFKCSRRYFISSCRNLHCSVWAPPPKKLKGV